MSGTSTSSPLNPKQASQLCDELISEVQALIVGTSDAAGSFQSELQNGIPEIEQSIQLLSKQPSREVVLAESVKLLRQQKQLASSARKVQHDTEVLRNQITELQQNLAEAQRLAEHDALTGLLNRQGLASRVEDLLAADRPMCLAVIDLDKFKDINDLYGHQVGDKVLEQFAHLCRANLTSSEIIARWGGEEFLVVLPDVALQGAVIAMEGLRRRLVATPLALGDGPRVSLTCSVGLTERHGKDDVFSSMYARADRACYEAKEAGRNQLKAVRSPGTLLTSDGGRRG